LFPYCSGSRVRSVPAGTLTRRPLVGRDSELAALVSLISDVAGGRGSSALIEGEPGIGKSALVRAAVAEGADLGCQVFWGAGDELGQPLPLLPMLDALRVREPSADTRRTTIVRLLRGELTADPGADVSAALAEQLLALVAELAAARPTILVIDDLQWADHATITLWRRLARLTPQARLMLVGTMRPVPQRDDLLALRRAVPDAIPVQLSALGEADVADLVADLAGGKPAETLLQLADGAAGNPLYITELIAALARSRGLTVTDAGAVELTSRSAPVSLSAAIADRLGFLSGQGREVVRAAALLGVDFAIPDLATVLGRGVADLVSALEEARAAGVITESGNELGFRHPLIRQALYEEMPRALRAAWHRDAGRALAAGGAPADRVARQLLWAVGGPDSTSDPMDDWMLSWLAGASDLLVGRAPQVAADLLRRAVASRTDQSPRHHLLVGRLADALYRVGNVSEAEKVARRALAYAQDADLVVDLHWTIAQSLMRSGRSAEAIEMLNRALTRTAISGRHRARLLVLTARVHSNLGEVEKAGQIAAAALEAASEAGDNWATGWALHVLTIVTAVQGNAIESLPLFERALAVTEADPALTDLRILLHVNQAVMLSGLDLYDEAFAAARQAQQLAEQAGTVIRLVQAHCALAQLYFDTGRWDEALAEALAVHEDLKEPGCACCDLGIAAAICFHRGDIGAARGHLAASVPHAERVGNRVIPPLALARSLDREHAGVLPEALARLTAGFASNAEELKEIEDLLPDAVRLASEVGDEDTAEKLAGLAGDLADESEIARRQATGLYCRGLVDHDGAALLQAADRYAAADRPLLGAQALEAAANSFVRTDDRDAARGAFTRALEGYAALGARTDVARLQARFRAYGIRRGPQSKHRRAQSGWDSLTPTETKIAALVESGLSNPDIAAQLFLSRRTVATHVSHILKKLNVQTRTDVAREAALRTIAPR
jgi:DNA-binding CsgD family transcriptional regulator/tetratricopeptide (TPR) repeat protein